MCMLQNAAKSSGTSVILRPSPSPPCLQNAKVPVFAIFIALLSRSSSFPPPVKLSAPLQVSCGKASARGRPLSAGLESYGPHGGLSSSAHRAPHWRPEPRGSQDYEQQQARKPHKPQPRPERGDRRQAPASSSGTAAASSLVRDAHGYRGGRAGGGGGGGRDGGEVNRDPSPDSDPLGALRSPRPSASSRKEAPAAKPEANGRLKTGYGGKSSNRDDGTGGKSGGSKNRTVIQHGKGGDTRASTTRPTNTASSDFYTSKFRRP